MSERADEIVRLREQGLTLAAICARLGVAKATVNRALYPRVRVYEKDYNRRRYYTATCERCGEPCTHNVHSKAARGRWCQSCYRTARAEIFASRRSCESETNPAASADGGAAGMSADRAAEVIATGDAEAILKMALGAMFAAEDGRFCECAEPSLHGRDLMCGNCLLENQGQIERLEALIRGPHTFEPSERATGRRMGWCGICAHPQDDPRHAAASVSAAGDEQ